MTTIDSGRLPGQDAPPVTRPADAADAPALALVGAATFLETFAGVLDGGAIVAHCAREHATERYAAWLRERTTGLWLATVPPGDAPVGYAVVAPAALPISDPRADDLELKRIYVLARFHGTGTGRALLKAAIEGARERGASRLLLGVYAGNARAIGFYQRQGFEAIGMRRFAVGDREYDDIIHQLALG